MNAPSTHRPTLLLAATRPEAQYVARALGVTLKASQIITHDWLLVTGGLGTHRVVAALHRAVRQKQVGRVIQFGYAGGLDPAMQPGHLESFVSLAEPSGRMISLESVIPRVLAKDEQPPAGPRLLSVPYVIHRPADKQRLLKYHRACMVDMESFAVAQACAQINLPYRLVRSVSDPADMALPYGADTWVDHDGNVRIGRVVRHVLFNPRSIRTILALSRNSRIAGEAMARQVMELLHQPWPA